MLKKIIIGCTIFVVIAAAAVSGWVYWLVAVEPGDAIQPENIRRILGKESHVYYSDGTTKLGVFFDTAHRQYVTFKEIPQTFINALVASEDERFFSHTGFDPIGIGRAMVRNIQAGKVVQGGSTLTQQTAKNLFKRTERSLEAKLKELLFAFRLEYHYSKEQIFEFYANQFYVSGNGHGLGVAARYYFDKTPQELTLVESAFIAGSVKRPNYYNPFIQKNTNAVELARSRAKARMRYVLDKMRDLAMISESDHDVAVDAEIEFKEGQVGFALDHAMEMVRDAVSSTEVLNALEDHNVANIATSGVRIITTIDRELQKKSLAGLRGELSRLDVRLRGYDRGEVQGDIASIDYSGDSEVREGEFLFGTIIEIKGKGKNVEIAVELDKQLGRGVIDSQGLAEMVKAFVKWRDNLWSEPAAGDQDRFLGQLQTGDRVWVSVRASSDNQQVLLSLERFPLVQGGAIVLKDGVVKGMAGGSENRFFNRAIHAKRTMGSAFKPLVYAAALQLGWNSADPLKNSRDLFVYQGQPYFPRPDHKSPFEWVSMNWAGVLSENVASVWLLAHLCDRLSPSQFREVADHLGLAPKMAGGDEEPYRSYSVRIRDRYGIQINQQTLRAAAYRKAVENLESDFIFDGIADEYSIIANLHYGQNFDRFVREIGLDLQQRDASMTGEEMDELEVRKQMLSRNYLVLKSLRDDLTAFQSTMEFDLEGIQSDPFDRATGTAGLYRNLISGEYSFNRMSQPSGYLTRVDIGQLRSTLAEMGKEERSLFWEKIRLHGMLTAAAFDKVEAQINYEYDKLTEELPYSFEVLSQVNDFRITVGLHYLIELARQLGVKGALEPVLSFPLGSNVVTLLEATRMYEGLVTGSVTTFGEATQDENNDSLAILARIESEDGTILFESTPVVKRVFDPKTTMAIGGILENVVKFGTGKTAGEKVRLQGDDQAGSAGKAKLGMPVPLLGKTGTANRYTNASFFGYLPGVTEHGDGLMQQGGYAVGTYVGFDDNQPMRRKSSRISGAAGALPTWCEIVNVLLAEQGYAKRLDPIDLSFYGLVIRRENLGQVNVAAALDKGGKVVEPMVLVSETERSQPSILTFHNSTDTERFKAERYFRPFWTTAAGSTN
jgi:membrane peptidoglycan carboxypeptidase